jgi:hypothetical protein
LRCIGALGWEYRRRRVIAGTVVYCAFEGAEGFKARAAAFRQHHNVAPDTEVPFFLIPTRIDLVKDYAGLIASVRDQSGAPVLAVLDTLNRSLRGSESSDEDMTAYLNAADAIREAFPCAVIIVHHWRRWHPASRPYVSHRHGGCAARRQAGCRR